MASKNKFEICNDEVHISREGWDTIAFASYREDYWDEMTSCTWTWVIDNKTKKRTYLTNTKLGSLHRYMMAKWYGSEVLNDMTSKGYVVDHLNNEPTDCRIQNLEFLKHNYNTAKGNDLDIDTKRLYKEIALSIYKDFETQNYQITIGCNDPISDPVGKPIDSFKLLYAGGDINIYRTVIHDAENILTTYDLQKKIPLDKLSANWIRIYYSLETELTNEEKEQAIVERKGMPLLILGNGKSFLIHVAPDKHWVLPENYDGKKIITTCTPHMMEND